MASSQPNIGYRFKHALMSADFAVIAEIKRRSPSAGELCPKADIASLARQYRQGGAACLSVLTEESCFGGSPADLQQAREASNLPVLRKDFLTSFEDIQATKAMGADALLLIVADIEPSILPALHELALELGLDVLTEVRNQAELEAASKAGAYMIAVNQRDNPKGRHFSVDYGRAVKMSPLFTDIDRKIIKVAASGIGVKGGTQLKDLINAGYDAALIGEALVTSADPTTKLRSLLS